MSSAQAMEMGASCVQKVKSQPCWKPFIKFIRFTIHFLVVMLLLGFGAFGFAMIENPVDSSNSNTTTKNSTKEEFFSYLNNIYNVSIPDGKQDEFLKDIRKHEKSIRMVVMQEIEKDRLNDRIYILKKWFYFVTVATTTIGYGDIYPVTKWGKIFYTGFSIVGIPLMMTLLALCGDIMTLVNKKIFGAINRCLCKKKKLVSEELLSSFSIFLLFAGYMTVGCMYVHYEHDWELVDSIYFWVVTFTTVGFGDMYIAIEDQKDWEIMFLIIYRLFGLALLAGLIDSLLAWMNKRKEILKEKAASLKNQKLLSTDLFFAKNVGNDKGEPCESDEFIEDRLKDVDLSKLTPKRISYC